MEEERKKRALEAEQDLFKFREEIGISVQEDAKKKEEEKLKKQKEEQEK